MAPFSSLASCPTTDRPSVFPSTPIHPSGDATQHVTKWKIHPRSRVCPGGGRGGRGGRGRDSILRPSVGLFAVAQVIMWRRRRRRTHATPRTVEQRDRAREGEPVVVAPSPLSIIRPSDALVSHADPPRRLSGVSRLKLCEIYVKTIIRTIQAENVVAPKLPSLPNNLATA